MTTQSLTALLLSALSIGLLTTGCAGLEPVDDPDELAPGEESAAGESTDELTTDITGTWSLIHGATGVIVLNADLTFTSTCTLPVPPVDYSTYFADPLQQCPDAAGTYAISGTLIDFAGVNGSVTRLEFGTKNGSQELFSAKPKWDRFYRALRLRRPGNVPCLLTSDSFWRYSQGPIATYVNGEYHLRGSNQVPSEAQLWSAFVSEIQPGYFVLGQQAGCTN